MAQPLTPLSKLPNFDPERVPVIGVDHHLPAVPAARLSAQALRQRFAQPPDWQPEVVRERKFAQREPALASVLVGIVTVGDGGIEWMNRSARRMFGGELADFVGEPIAAVVTETRQQGADAAGEHAGARGGPVDVGADPEAADHARDHQRHEPGGHGRRDRRHGEQQRRNLQYRTAPDAVAQRPGEHHADRRRQRRCGAGAVLRPAAVRRFGYLLI